MTRYYLQIQLVSDGCFGRGDGVAGTIDAEIEHDPDTGLPMIGGRLKGLLAEECANTLFALECCFQHNTVFYLDYRRVAGELFGRSGSQSNDTGWLEIGSATYPQDLIDAVRREIVFGNISTHEVLSALTTIRRRTANSEETGAPLKKSLRSLRMMLRKTELTACVDIRGDIDNKHNELLAACVYSLRRGGLSRNRGAARVNVTLVNDQGIDIGRQFLNSFRESASRACTTSTREVVA